MNRRHFLGGVLATLAALTHSRLFGAPEPAAKPNFLFLLSDDQNWDGLSVGMDPKLPNSKSVFVETPSIAKLASQGMRFTQAYAPAPVCSPTRISLQTGKSPAQLNWTKAGPSMRAADGFKLLVPTSIGAIPREETTVAELLKTAGYTTAHYGKWHLSGGGPENHGYDESDGDTSNHDAAPFKAPNPVDIFGMNKRAASFMKKASQAGKPFFIQMSYNALHYPENAIPETIAKYKRKIGDRKERPVLMAAIAENLDTGVGELLKAVEDLGLAETTYVIYMSDNGGGGGGRHRVLRGGKGNVLEGGIRVPLIIRGPGVKPDSVCRIPVVGFDFLPTFCAMGGVKRPLPTGVEGGDFSHLLAGSDKPIQRLREELVFHFPHYQGETPHSAIRVGDDKLIHFYEDDHVELYDLAKDAKEQTDLAARFPDKAAAMKKRLAAYLKDVSATLPSPNPKYDPENPPVQERGRPELRDSDRRQGRRRPLRDIP